MNRLLYNQAIVNKLQELIKKYPDWRFGQLLTNIDIIRGSHIESDSNKMVVTDPFYEESKDIWERMCNNNYCFDKMEYSVELKTEQNKNGIIYKGSVCYSINEEQYNTISSIINKHE